MTLSLSTQASAPSIASASSIIHADLGSFFCCSPIVNIVAGRSTALCLPFSAVGMDKRALACPLIVAICTDCRVGSSIVFVVEL
jgi:hypothetical protein